jgi:hypothetical protein
LPASKLKQELSGENNYELNSCLQVSCRNVRNSRLNWISHLPSNFSARLWSSQLSLFCSFLKFKFWGLAPKINREISRVMKRSMVGVVTLPIPYLKILKFRRSFFLCIKKVSAKRGGKIETNPASFCTRKDAKHRW